jgi:dTDP-glucose 4,6-dehydratase
MLMHADRTPIIGQAINVGVGQHRTIFEIAGAVREAMGNPPSSPIRFIGDRPGQVFRHTCDAAKARRMLGWEPQIPFEQALEHTIRWYSDNEAWWRPQIWMRQIPIISASGKREMH